MYIVLIMACNSRMKIAFGYDDILQTKEMYSRSWELILRARKHVCATRIWFCHQPFSAPETALMLLINAGSEGHSPPSLGNLSQRSVTFTGRGWTSPVSQILPVASCVAWSILWRTPTKLSPTWGGVQPSPHAPACSWHTQAPLQPFGIASMAGRTDTPPAPRRSRARPHSSARSTAGARPLLTRRVPPLPLRFQGRRRRRGAALTPSRRAGARGAMAEVKVKPEVPDPMDIESRCWWLCGGHGGRVLGLGAAGAAGPCRSGSLWGGSTPEC